jgi:hypothetical protein
MVWECQTYWVSHERYELRMIRPDLWVVYGPDGWVDTDISKHNVENLAEAHLKDHPVIPI